MLSSRSIVLTPSKVDPAQRVVASRASVKIVSSGLKAISRIHPIRTCRSMGGSATDNLQNKILADTIVTRNLQNIVGHCFVDSLEIPHLKTV